MTELAYSFVLLANVAWFGSAFWSFAFKHETGAKLLIPKSARSSPVFATMSAALPFLGGMNAAFALLAVLAGTPGSFRCARGTNRLARRVCGRACVPVCDQRPGGSKRRSHRRILLGCAPRTDAFYLRGRCADDRAELAMCVVARWWNLTRGGRQESCGLVRPC